MQTAIITGAGGQLGKFIVKKLAAEKYFIAGTLSANKKNKLPEKKEQWWEALDLQNEEATNSFVQQVIKKRKRIDVLVTTVGGFAMGNIENTPGAAIQKQLDLNFHTTYNIVRPVFLEMKKQGKGRIFLIGSRSGDDARLGKETLAYTLSKSLLFRLAEILNKEAGNLDIVTTVIVPSVIDTPQNRKDMPDADFSKWVKAEKIAGIISFYASATAIDIKNPVIKVFGGA